MSSSLPSDNETIGGNNTINGNDYDYSSSSSMNLHQLQRSSVSRSGNEHGDGNENQNENKNDQKGLAWMPQVVKEGKSLRAENKERHNERKKKGTVQHWSRDDKVLTEDGKIKSCHDAGINSYAAGNGLSKTHKAIVEAELQLAQKVMRVVRAKPVMNAYDPDTQNFACKNVPLLAAMVVNGNKEESPATTATFLRYMDRADWNYTDPREHKNSPIEKGQVFVFSRNDDLFDMNDDEKVATIVVKTLPARGDGSAGSNWLQKEKEDLFKLVSKYSSLYRKWPEIMVEFNKKHPSRGITVPTRLSQKFHQFKKEYEAWLAAKKRSSSEKKNSTMAVSASDKKPAAKKSAKGTPKSAAASSNAADADAPKKRKAKTASIKADVPKKKRRMSAVDSSDEDSSSDEDEEWVLGMP